MQIIKKYLWSEIKQVVDSPMLKAEYDDLIKIMSDKTDEEILRKMLVCLDIDWNKMKFWSN